MIEDLLGEELGKLFVEDRREPTAVLAGEDCWGATDGNGTASRAASTPPFSCHCLMSCCWWLMTFST